MSKVTNQKQTLREKTWNAPSLVAYGLRRKFNVQCEVYHATDNQLMGKQAVRPKFVQQIVELFKKCVSDSQKIEGHRRKLFESLERLNELEKPAVLEAMGTVRGGVFGIWKDKVAALNPHLKIVNDSGWKIKALKLSVKSEPLLCTCDLTMKLVQRLEFFNTVYEKLKGEPSVHHRRLEIAKAVLVEAEAKLLAPKIEWLKHFIDGARGNELPKESKRWLEHLSEGGRKIVLEKIRSKELDILKEYLRKLLELNPDMKPEVNPETLNLFCTATTFSLKNLQKTKELNKKITPFLKRSLAVRTACHDYAHAELGFIAGLDKYISLHIEPKNIPIIIKRNLLSPADIAILQAEIASQNQF